MIIRRELNILLLWSNFSQFTLLSWRLRTFGKCNPFVEVPPTLANIALIASHLNLLSSCQGCSITPDALVHSCLATTSTNCLYLRQDICIDQQVLAALEWLSKEVAAEAIAEHGDLQLICNVCQLNHLLLVEKLRFIHQQATNIMLLIGLFVFLSFSDRLLGIVQEIEFCTKLDRRCFEADAGSYLVFANQLWDEEQGPQTTLVVVVACL